MRRRAIVLTALIGVGLAGWVILDADPEGRRDLWSRVTTLFRGNTEPPPAPNWGDVATRIGAFTDEERNLREVLNENPVQAPNAPAP